MKQYFKISLVIMVISAILAIFASVVWRAPEALILVFGSGCCLGGCISLLLALVHSLDKNKELARAYFLAAGITFLVGTGTCSSMALVLN